MATKTRTVVRPRKAKAAITVVRVNGLQGKGLIQLGKESRLELRDRLQMPRVVFGRVVNVSERTIAKVEAEAEQVEKLRRPYTDAAFGRNQMNPGIMNRRKQREQSAGAFSVISVGSCSRMRAGKQESGN